MAGQTKNASGPDSPSAKQKKTRLNPARRKSAAKSKVDPSSVSSTVPSAPVLPANVQSTASSKQNAANDRATQITRTRTTPPVPTSKQGSATSSDAQKPGLNRARTTPQSGSKSISLALKTPALVTGGLVGCAAGAAILLGVGIWYDFAGPESAILAARAAKLCVDNLAEEVITSLKAGTYSADEALDMLRRTTLAYASTIPGGAPFVERMFREVDMVRKQRGREVDKVVAETYAKLTAAGRKGATPVEMQAIVLSQLTKLSTFASKATQDVVARNPQLRPFRDETITSLKGPPEPKVPTVRLNMAVRQKQ